ncbi:MAG: alpha/beta hydrolase [Bacteroidota bacterium]
MLDTLQKKLIFRPKRLELDKPLNLSAPHEEFFLRDEKLGLNIHSVFMPAQGLRKGLVLYYHGNSDNLQRWTQYAEDFTKRNHDILLIDYPGFGKSSGNPTEENVYHAAELSYKWALERMEAGEIVIYGRSIGTAPASFLASKKACKQLVLETPFYSLKDLFDHHPLYRFIDPVYSMPVHQFLSEVQQPISIFQGTKDRIVPFRSAARLKGVLKESDNFFVIPGGKHKDLGTFSSYQENLSYILE